MYKEVYNHHTVRAIEYMMKDYIRLLDMYLGISEIVELDQWDQFIKLNDSIIHILPFMQKSEKVNQMKDILHKINKRDLYKSVGEIISDNILDIGEYDNNKFIIDTIKLSYYSREKCKYIQRRESRDLSEKIENNDKYITSIYYKDIDDKEEAHEMFRKIE